MHEKQVLFLGAARHWDIRDACLGLRHLGDRHDADTVVDVGRDLRGIRVRRKRERPHELAVAALDAVELVGLLLMLVLALPADGQEIAVRDLDFDVLRCEARRIRLDDVRLLRG